MSSPCAEARLPRLLLAIAELPASGTPDQGAARGRLQGIGSEQARQGHDNGRQPRRVQAGIRGEAASHLGRERLSRLAAGLGFDCPVAGWSPRGAGPPRHPGLPSPWTACLSHSGSLVVAGLAEVPVGLDIECPDRRQRQRHRSRLDGLIATLPEASVRRAIQRAPDALAAFYRGWTLYEAHYKLGCLEGQPPDHVLATRIGSLMALDLTDMNSHSNSHTNSHSNRQQSGDPLYAWQAQDDRLTLSLCARELGLSIEMRLGGLEFPDWTGLPQTFD